MPTTFRTLAEDDVLRDFAAARDDDSRMSVIVEVQTPAVRLSKTSSGTAVRGVVSAGTSERSNAGAQKLHRLASVLRSEGAEDPTVIPGAQALVVSVKSSQLRRLDELPDVAVIRRNRSVPAR